MSVYFRIVTAICLIIFLILMNSYNASAQPFGIGATQAEQKNSNTVLCSESGRYVFGQLSDSTRDIFMLDTKTGRLWRAAESGKIGLYLKPVPYLLKSMEGDEYSSFPEPESGTGQDASEK